MAVLSLFFVGGVATHSSVSCRWVSVIREVAACPMGMGKRRCRQRELLGPLHQLQKQKVSRHSLKPKRNSTI